MRSTCCIAFLVLAACASSPVTLVALPPAPHVAAQHSGGPNSGTTILLRPLVMPGYLDAYPVVTGHNGSTLIVSSKTEWAEPLSDAAARVLRDALSQRLGASRVLIAGDGRIPDADLTVEFIALDPQQGTLRLDAKWSFSCTSGERPQSWRPQFLRSPARSRDAARRCSRYCGCFGAPGRRARDAGRMPG